MRDLLRLLRYVRPYIGRLGAAIFSSLGISLCYIGVLSLILPIFDEVFQQDPVAAAATGGKIRFLDDARLVVESAARYVPALEDLSTRVQEGATGTAILVAILAVILFTFKGVFTYATTYMTRWVGLQVVRDLRGDLYARIQNQSLAFFSRHPSGQLISRVMGDVARMQRTIAGDLAEIFRLGSIVCGQVAWLFYLNWRLSGFCLILLPLIIVPVVRFGARLKATSRRSMERTGEAVEIMKEGVRGTRIVQAFGMVGYEIGRFNMALDRILRVEKRGARILSITGPVLEVLGAIGAALLFAYASSRIGSGKLTPGEFGTFAGALVMIFLSLKHLAKINNEVQQAAAAARRVFEIMDTENPVRDQPDALEMSMFRERIEFRKVSFSYGDAPALRGVDLEVRRGEVVAIVGSSGAGKTTLVNLLSRFHDVTSGAVLIDGTDVRDVTLRSLREQIGLVTQDVILFDGSVRENIAYGQAGISLEHVVRAARSAHAHSFIESLPNKYDTPLGEEGHRLSLGQRQRLSIARAILKDSPILILDEATSSLDAESEAQVQGALQNLMEGRTVFVIAHRLSTVRSADRIIVLDEGRIVEQGTHESLLTRKGVYARLHALQFRDEPTIPKASIV
jgi:subfamily B ATP-binding cassette protein MsbA